MVWEGEGAMRQLCQWQLSRANLKSVLTVRRMNTKVDWDGRDSFVLAGNPIRLVFYLPAHVVEIGVLLSFLMQKLGEF